MEWRITECSHGGYTVDHGEEHDGGVLGPRGVGVTMPAFIVTESAHCSTLKEAERYIQRRERGERR